MVRRGEASKGYSGTEKFPKLVREGTNENAINTDVGTRGNGNGQTATKSEENLRDKKVPHLAPSRAIRKECRKCMGGARLECDSKICPLNGPDRSSLRKIRRHCLDCAGSPGEVRACEGKIPFGVDGPHICPLHDYRFGTNPRRKGVGNRRPLLSMKIRPRTPNSERGFCSRNDDLR